MCEIEIDDIELTEDEQQEIEESYREVFEDE
jgi:hypothetical protein